MGISLLTPVDVVIDSREDAKNPDVRRALELNGLKTAVAKLEVGDYLLLTGSREVKPILIERKTSLDLANSIKDNRVWEQARLLLDNCADNNYQPLIIVEGDLSRLEKRGWSIQSVLRAIDTLLLEYGVPVLNTPNKESTIKWMIAKAKSLGKTMDKKVFRLRVEKKPMTIHEKIVYVAESFSGPVLARRLLKKFGSLRNIANASIADLMQVEGIGEGRAREIYMIFNTNWTGDGDV